jgi:hypothetical protein
MRKVASIFALVVWVSVVPALAAETFKVLHVEDLDALIRGRVPNLWVYDANPPSTRRSEGIIPGAKLLSSFNRYDVAAELPPRKDAKLVFYCANSH